MKKTALNEAVVEIRARNLVAQVNPQVIPVPVEAYAGHVGAAIRQETDLRPNEPGWSFEAAGKCYICINVNDRRERQRFTVCHELAHIVLGIPSDHKAMPWWSYAKRTRDEILCDVFAAELLLPYRLFKPIAEKETIGFATLDSLAGRFDASVTATGSRFATVTGARCAFVLSEQGKVRYASRSPSLRAANGWIETRIDLPKGSGSARARAGERTKTSEEGDPESWFSGWKGDGVLLEEARHLTKWDQTLTLLWFDD